MSARRQDDASVACCAVNRREVAVKGDVKRDLERDVEGWARSGGSRRTGAVAEPRDVDRVAHDDRALADRVIVPAGANWVGTDEPGFPEDGEGPRRRVRLDAFALDRCAVSNLRFHDFVHDTGYVTDAERYGWSFVFFAFVSSSATVGASPANTPWWRQTFGANWRHPFGPGSNLTDRWDHPVVHVSWRDARAFATWASGRLPSEAEWECAGRGGLQGRTFPWGDALEEGGAHHANVWQGTFPTWNAASDGYVGTAPVDAFEPNAYGLYDMVGNVWEWCEDAFTVTHDPAPASNPVVLSEQAPRVMKGGSYLCHDSYCNRYRLAARTKGDEVDGSGNVGFRVAYDLVS